MCSKKLLAVLALMAGWLSASCPAQTFTLLHAFAPVVSGTNADGDFPYAQLARSGNVLYGTTFNAGANSNGTVFAVNVDGTGFTNLHVFSVRGGPLHTNADGGWPGSGVVVSGNRLFGTTGLAGPTPFGTVYAMNTDGSSFTNLHVFGGNHDGNSTFAGLVLSGSRLYGASQGGGTNAVGTIFGLNTDGSGYTNLHSFASLTAARTVKAPSPWPPWPCRARICLVRGGRAGRPATARCSALTRMAAALRICTLFPRSSPAPTAMGQCRMRAD